MKRSLTFLVRSKFIKYQIKKKWEGEMRAMEKMGRKKEERKRGGGWSGQAQRKK